VAAATYQPAPAISVAQGSGADQTVTLRSWDSGHDMALLVLAEGNQPVLHASGASAARVGQQVYLVSGSDATGGPGGSITTGKLSEASATLLEDDARPVVAGAGGPLIDASGSVLGLDSSAYSSPAASPSPVQTSTAVPIQEACADVLVCLGGSFPST
jgi:hypothetical protein